MAKRIYFQLNPKSDVLHWVWTCSRMVASRARFGAGMVMAGGWVSLHHKKPSHFELCDECKAKQKRIDAAVTKV